MGPVTPNVQVRNVQENRCAGESKFGQNSPYSRRHLTTSKEGIFSSTTMAARRPADNGPNKMGWRKKGDTLVPVQMEEKPVPKNIMELIFCGCKGYCNLNTCSCWKHGLPCNLAYKICEGSTCLNTERYSDENVNVPETEASDEGDVPHMNTSVDDEENDQTQLSY
ncbi:unnamed protein product [Psylliodes chrysocephalus]|uniref:Tesmin/TSO1-like CXC domain-containing protein n=1 Tax=Psylliodes chrysocephalus TaxID=3402493 RepID=A0A9P0CPZ1_9CUCU|nr:unnamed protein product [Psylliodes chrysocephala]